MDDIGPEERAALQKIVRAKNADRERMIKEITIATSTDLDEIRTKYANKLRQKAKNGDWIQIPDESWRQK